MSSISPNDSLSIADFASLFGFEASAVAQAVEAQKYRAEKAQAFFSIPQLATRWDSSRAHVYDILRENNVRILDFTGKGKAKGKKLVPREVVERIERTRMRKLR
jgi:hypothetical protein